MLRAYSVRSCLCLVVTLALAGTADHQLCAQSSDSVRSGTGQGRNIVELGTGFLSRDFVRRSYSTTMAASVSYTRLEVLRRLDLRVASLLRPQFVPSDRVSVFSSALVRVATWQGASLTVQPFLTGGVGVYSNNLRDVGAHYGVGARAVGSRTSVSLEWTRHRPIATGNYLALSLGFRL